MEKARKNNYIVITMLAVATLLITYLLPEHNHKAFDYDFAEGKPWRHERLEAKFDFDIEYDSAQKAYIQDSIEHNFIKIYHIDASARQANLAQLDMALNANAGASATLKRDIHQQVNKLYADGIVDNATADAIAQGQLPQVRILSGNRYQQVPTQHMRSAVGARNYLDSVFGSSEASQTLIQIKVADYLQPNVLPDSIETHKLISDAVHSALLVSQGHVQAGQTIVEHGAIVDARTFAVLQTYRDKLNRPQEGQAQGIDYSQWGQFIFVAIMMMVFYYFMKLMRPSTFANLRKMVFLVLFTTLFIILVEVLLSFKSSALYLIPFALMPIVITSFFDSRTSFFIYMVVILLCSLAVNDQAEFIIMQFLAGNIAIVSVKELSKRSQLARCALFIFLAYSVMFVALHVMRTGSFTGMVWMPFLLFGINCVVLSVASFIIYIIEKLFGFTSSLTLVELTDINNPELRALSAACPGTFQHSMQVANLAAEAAHEIGANVQLARSGALYHDIGKINNPAFFTENQVGVNPHDALTPEQSARIVIAHVTDGVQRAEKAKLPAVIKDFIMQHHGRGVTRYFYAMACKQHPGEKVDPAPFTYPGPNPQSKETAIVMMADACEAATRSLKNPDEKAISDMVNKIIDGQISEGLLNEAPLSFRDVGIIKSVFIERLRTIYHMRISYPDDVKPAPAPASDDEDDDEANS